MSTDTIHDPAQDWGGIQVSERIAWAADHGWDTHGTHVDGHLTDGTELDVVSARDHALPRSAGTAARDSWLHGKVLTAHLGVDGAEALVVPDLELAPVVVAEAVRRHGYGHTESLD